MSSKRKDTDKIERQVVNTILERPITFTLDGRFFYLYPPSFGILLLSQPILKSIEFDDDMLKFNADYEMLRICTQHREDVLRLIAYHSFKRRSDAIEEEQVVKKIEALSSLDAPELTSLLIGVLEWNNMQKGFLKHFHIDKDKEDRDKVTKVKGDGSSIVFGGRSVFGNLIDFACERYKWQVGYVVWGISYLTLNMMMADSIQSVFLSKDDKKKLNISTDREVINADDPKNAHRIAQLLSID